MPTPPSDSLRFVPFSGIRQYLVSLTGFDRNVKLFLTATAFRGMVIATLMTVLNLYLYSLGYDARFIGIINAANSVAVLLVSVPLGFLADRFGRQRVLLVGGIGYPLSILGVALAGNTAAIMAFNFLFGAFAAAYWVAGVPLLYASTAEGSRVQAFSVNSFLLWGIGPLGAFLSGQVVEIAARVLHVSSSSTSALRIGMMFMVVLALGGSVPFLFLRERAVPAATQEPAPPLALLARLLAQLLIPDLVLAFGLGAVLTFIQLYFHLRFQLDPGAVGIVVAVGGIVSGAATLLTPLVARRWGNLRSTVRFQWIAVPFLTVMAFSMSLGIAVAAYWLVLTLRGMSDPVYTAFVQERVPEIYRSRVTGLYSVTYSIGYSLGPALSGQVQKVSGFTPAFMVGTICYFLGATLLYLFFSRGDRAPAETLVGRSA
jgi:MFS family permease